MRFHWANAALAAVLMAAPAWGQGQQPPAGERPEAAAVPKVAVLDVRQAIVTSAEGKQASAELQSRFAARQTELENLRKQVEDLNNRLRAGQTTMNDEEKARIGREIESLSRTFQRRQEDLREDIGFAEQEIVDRIGRKMREVVDRYARENGFAIILDISGQSPVIYASNSVDITPDIIRLYDQANPVAAAQPPRPQPGQARPPQQQPGQRPPQP